MKSKLKLAVLLDVSRAYERDLLAGITNYNKLHDKFVFFFRSPGYMHARNEETLVQRIISWKPDGVFTREMDGVKKLFKLNVPLIVAPHTELYKGRVNLWGNGEETGRMVGAYFITRGYKNFAFLGFKDFQWSLERQEGFLKYLNQKGLPVSEFIFDNNRMKWEELPAKLASWLHTIKYPCAIFTATDELNIPLLEAANAIEAKVPDDISVIGVDNDTMICEMSRPTLSSVDLNAVQAGFEVAQALNRWIEYGEKPVANIVVPSGMIITRTSTNALAIDDEQVRTALYFIANTAPTEDLSVDDVVRATTLSRRNLEKRFQSAIKNSILDEIRKVRIGRIRFLLAHSKLTVQQIAFELNFKNIDNITRYFRQGTGISPVEYRNRNKKA